jgi:putative flippase GtrA
MRSLLESALVRHQAGAILATLLDFTIGGMLVRAGLDPALATFLGAAVGACCNFAIARRYVFRGEGRRIGRQALRYSLVAFGSALANALLVHALGALFPFALARPIAAVIVSLAWNYPLHRSFVFGEAPVSERP